MSTTTTFTKTATIKAVNEAERTATAAVLVPDELDHQADFFRPDAIERFYSDDVATGVMHAAFPDDAATLERSEIIDEPETIGDEEFPAGTWIATRRYEDDDLWALVEDGVLTGFSIGGDVADGEEFESPPDDVTIPDAVPDDVADGPVTGLSDGTVNEISDVDLPAVPRATYKGRDLGKSVLEDVDGEDEFVEVMTEQRGHTEDEARRLYAYLVDVRNGEKTAGVEKPFTGPQGQEFEDFADCVETVEDWDNIEDPEAACGAWQAETKVDVDGTEIDLTPPPRVVNAVTEAFAAKEEYADALGDCGTGVGEAMGEAILNAELTPEIVLNGGDIAQNDPETYLDGHQSDVDAEGQPTEWSEDDWTDGCAEVQQALWGFYPDWFADRKAEIQAAMDDSDTEAANVTTHKFDYDTDDFVSWDASGGRAMGRIVDRTEDGQFDQAISGDITVDGTEDDPAYLIEVYDDQGGEAEPIEEESGRGDTMHVAHRESEIREIDDPREQAASKSGVFAWLWKRFGATESDDGATSPEAPGTSTATTDDAAAKALEILEKDLTPEQTEIVAELAEEFVEAHGDASVGEFRDWFWEMEWADELDPDQIVALSGAFEDWYDEMAADAQIVTEAFADWVAEQTDGEIDLSKYAPAGDTADGPMSDDDTTTNEPPEWATDLTEKVESIEKRVAELDGDGDADADAEKSLEDAPDWASSLAEKVDDLDERVETIATQSGHSQQLGKTDDGEETEKNNGFTLDPRKAG